MTITPLLESSFLKFQVLLKTLLKLSKMQVVCTIVLAISYLAGVMLKIQVARPGLLTAATQEKEDQKQILLRTYFSVSTSISSHNMKGRHMVLEFKQSITEDSRTV